MSLISAKSALSSFASPGRKKTCESFFKTGPGGYAEGDIFIGVRTPEIRAVAKEFTTLSLDELSELISSKIHEERLLALFILISQFKKSPDRIYEFYLSHMDHVNNWDLVDQSAHYIMGAYLIDKDKAILYDLAESENLWHRRIAMVATWWFIRNNQFDDVIKLARLLLKDKHDLMHKAVGWMLREMGKKDVSLLRDFLAEHRAIMPRTALRYSIERFDNEERMRYLKG